MGLGRVWIGAHRFWSLVKLAHPRPDAFRYFEKPGAMPLPSFAPNEKADLLRDTDPDLVFLMASHRVPEELQLAIFATHDTMALFSKLDRDEEGIRAFLATEWDLRPSNGVASRRTISLLLTAWEAAREQVAKENQARAEARISGKPIDIIAHDFELMKKACGKEHGRDFTKPQIPCRVMVQDKMRAIENNDPQADELQECLADDKSTHEELLAAEIGKDSRIAITKAAKVKGKIPRNAEELRAAHKLVGHSWLFARAKQNSRSWLKDLLPDTFVEFSDFILGERVAGIEIKLEDKVAMYPSFKLLLSFEFALRKSATEWTREGRGTLAECMKLVCKDRELRDMHFLEPLKFRAEASRLEDPRNVGSGALAMYPANNFSTFGKGGDGKGKGKHGKGKTSDGKQMAVCYAFNDKNRHCDGSCNMLHRCLICGEKHPAYNHQKFGQAGGAWDKKDRQQGQQERSSRKGRKGGSKGDALAGQEESRHRSREQDRRGQRRERSSSDRDRRDRKRRRSKRASDDSEDSSHR